MVWNWIKRWILNPPTIALQWCGMQIWKIQWSAIVLNPIVIWGAGLLQGSIFATLNLSNWWWFIAGAIFGLIIAIAEECRDRKYF